MENLFVSMYLIFYFLNMLSSIARYDGDYLAQKWVHSPYHIQYYILTVYNNYYYHHRSGWNLFFLLTSFQTFGIASIIPQKWATFLFHNYECLLIVIIECLRQNYSQRKGESRTYEISKISAWFILLCKEHWLKILRCFFRGISLAHSQ